MASLKDIKRQIRAVKQTQKLTKAMNMVAAAKLRATQGRTESFRAYAEEHQRLLEAIGRQPQELEHPLFRRNEEASQVKVLAISSDRGLCGSFNTNLSHLLDKKIVEWRGRGQEVSLFLVGRKLRDYYSRRKALVASIQAMAPGVLGNFDYPLAQEITKDLTEEFIGGKLREVWILTTKFMGMARQEPVLIPLLPLVPATTEERPVQPLGYGYLVEPDPATLFNHLIPRSLTIAVFQALLESVTSENAARMQAMDNASKNCKEITESLTTVYNKLRQAAVTNELLDIVNGSEALAAA
jgi:F-type H+-transporting ATPase subunit gamma